ncbi:MAG: dehydratase [Actinomycetales bacterium]|nr:dehydratase [Actinomycetales bacterium]
MSGRLRFADVSVGMTLPPLDVPIVRASMIRYAGASGDFNVIHWSERIATAVGLPNVIAHGMLTMAEAGRLLTNWAGDPGAVEQFGVRFTRPVLVPDDDSGALLMLTGEVTELLDGNRVRVSVVARSEGVTVLGKARAILRLA